VKSSIDLVAVFAAALTLGACILAGVRESWDVLAIVLAISGAVMALLSLRE
jgi:hypothetical protein